MTNALTPSFRAADAQAPRAAAALNRRALLRRGGALALALTVAGCATPIVMVAAGDATIGDKWIVPVDRPWNQFPNGLGDGVATWTREGVTLDAVRFWTGLDDGKAIVPTPNKEGLKPLIFKSSMPLEDIALLYQTAFTRDGSTFETLRRQPVKFLGANGLRVDYRGVHAGSQLPARGVLWVAVINGKLHAMNYQAASMAFFEPQLPSVEKMAAGARLKG